VISTSARSSSRSLLDVERVAFHARGRFTRGEPFLVERLAVTDAADVSDEHSDQHRNGSRDRIAGPFEERLASRESRGEIAPPPCVGELIARNLRATGREQLDLVRSDRLAVRPGRDLVDLGGELLGVLPDHFDEKTRRFGVDSDVAFAELLHHPIR
jgi:hypothetical protein